MSRFLFIILFLPILFCSCTSTQNRQLALAQKGIYAVHDSIHQKRYDLAKKYSDELVKIVPPPKAKDKAKIKSFTVPKKIVNNVVVPEKTLVVLPAEDKKENVIVEDTPEYKDILDTNKILFKQVTDEHQAFEKHKEKTEQLIIDKEKELEKLRNKPGFFARIGSLFKWGGIFGIIGIIGVGLLIFLVPGAIPFILSIVRLIGSCFSFVLSLFGKFINFLEGRVPK